MINKRLHTPEGVKDFKPKEFAYKRGIEKTVETTFLSNGYRRVATPTLEFSEVFNTGSVSEEEKYRFLSREGDILVLRSDMTPPICRLAAASYEDSELPLRFYYVENMFRYNEKNQGKLREMTQAGIELLGVGGAKGDCEVLICAVSALLNLGLEDFKIDIGHSEFLEGALSEAGVVGEACERIKAAIVDKNYVGVSEIIEGLDVEGEIKEFLCSLPLYLGGVEVLERAEKIFKTEKPLNAIRHMKGLYEVLKGCGFDRFVCFDLGIVPQLEYYTGIIFRGYANGSGYSVLSGGRYDRLSASFGRDFAAVGFILKINELMSVLKGAGIKFKDKKADTLLVFDKKARCTALSAGIALRKNGMNIENFYGGIEEGLVYAEKKGLVGVLYFQDNENVKIFNVSEGAETVVGLSELLEAEEK